MMKIVNKSNYLLCPIRSRYCVIAESQKNAMNLKPCILRFLHKSLFIFYFSRLCQHLPRARWFQWRKPYAVRLWRAKMSSLSTVAIPRPCGQQINGSHTCSRPMLIGNKAISPQSQMLNEPDHKIGQRLIHQWLWKESRSLSECMSKGGKSCKFHLEMQDLGWCGYFTADLQWKCFIISAWMRLCVSFASCRTRMWTVDGASVQG